MSRHIARIANVAAVTIVLVAGLAKGGPPGTPPGQQAPTNLALPSISGVPVVDGVLTADPGSWDGKGLKFAYQWLRCDSNGAACSAVENASSATYTIAPNLPGARLRVAVTASNKNGSEEAASDATDAVAGPIPPPPPSPPDPVPPSNTQPPAIGGVAQVGQTLTASPGSWSGTTPLEYGYQWKRCDSVGTSCRAIADATKATYSLSSNDVSSSLSVSVTTTNSAGSATASSGATPVVTAPDPSTPTTPPYFVEEFDGTLPSPWLIYPSGSVPSLINSVSNGSGGKAARLICTPISGGPNSSSELTSLFLGFGDSRIHTDRGEETWYRVRMRFSSGAYFPTTGQWNWHVEWHNDNKTSSYGSYSTALGVYTDYPVVSGQVGKNPRLALRLAGGLSSSPRYESHELPLNSLKYDHWYDIVFRITWGTDTDGTGSIGWWVDGTKHLDKPFPMLQRNPDDSVDRPAFGLYNYRLHDPSHTSEVHFDSVAIGPSAASVGFTP